MSHEIEHAVDKGIQCLDIIRPNWRDEIDVDSLDLDCPASCIIGQLFDSYFDFSDAFGHDFMIKNGFESELNSYELTEEWKRRLEKVYDLETESVDIGLYEVVSTSSNSIFYVGQEIRVIKLGGVGALSIQIINSVMIRGDVHDYTYYINPLIKVKRVD